MLCDYICICVCVFQAQGSSSSEVPSSGSEAETRPSTGPSPAQLSLTPALFFKYLVCLFFPPIVDLLPHRVGEGGPGVCCLCCLCHSTSDAKLSIHAKPYIGTHPPCTFISLSLYCSHFLSRSVGSLL